jgi:S-layer homology domain
VKRLWIAPLGLAAAVAGVATGAVQDICGPFTDVSPALCPYVLEMYYLGITAGTSPTTYSPDNPVTRGQAAVFVSKGVNQAIARSSRRAALGQWWPTTPHWDIGLGATPVGPFPSTPAADGADIWVASLDDTIRRVRASDGRLLETWTGADGPALVAMGRVFVAKLLPAQLYAIDPAAPAGAAQLVAADIGTSVSSALAYDGSRIWATSCCAVTIPPSPPPPGSVSIITPGTWSAQTITAGFDEPSGLVFDGTNMWVVDGGASSLFRLDSEGAIVQTISITAPAGQPAFDGANLWVPTEVGTLVVQASTGQVLTTLNEGSGGHAAFDGSRVLVLAHGQVTVWDAQSLALIDTAPTGFVYGFGATSDGINFWLSLDSTSHEAVLARF